MNGKPLESLELRVIEQRARIHKTADELKAKVAVTRENLDITKNAREHFAGASLAVSFLGFLMGYSLAGVFTES
jgi:hypothetical protein